MINSFGFSDQPLKSAQPLETSFFNDITDDTLEINKDSSGKDYHNSSTVFKIGLNHQIIGKCEPQNLSYAGAFIPSTVTIAQLADHISKGHPWMPGVLDTGAIRRQHLANYAEVLGADIDGGMTIAGALENPLIKNHCSLLIESASSKPELEKFRLVFVLPRAAEGYQLIKVLNRYLIDLLGVADKACKDASRFFFGAPGRSPKLLQSVTLPESFIEDAIAWDKEIELEKVKKCQAALSRRIDNPTDPNDLRDLVESALSFIPPRMKGQNTYDDCITCLFALYSAFGDAAIAIAERWSPSNGDWDIAKKVQSFGRGSTGRAIGLGSLFHLAQQNGWNFPKRESSHRFFDRTPKQIEQGIKSETKTYSQTLAEQSRSAGLEKWQKRRGFTPTLTINSQYLNIADIPLDAKSGVLAIRSGLGTGKSTVLLKMIDYIVSHSGDLGIIAIGSRNNLLLQQCKALNLSHIHNNGSWMLKCPNSRIALCFDSLHQYENHLDCFDGKILIMDEFVSVLKHALTSATCTGRRSELLDILDELIRCAAFVILLDGNGCDWAVEYVMKVRGGDSGAEKILNQYKNATTQFEVVSSFSQSGLVEKILELLPGYKALGQSIAIATDSQKTAEKLDIMFSGMGYRVFRIDSKTSGSKEVRGFIEAPDRNYDVLIYSPSAESGVNVDLPGFAHVFGMFYGLVDAETQIQMLRRVRTSDRITVFCVPYKRVNHAFATSNGQFLEELGSRILLDGAEGLDGFGDWYAAQTNTPRFESWRGLAIDREFEQRNTTLCLLEMAKIHGYCPKLIDLDDSKELGSKLAEIGKAIALREAEGIFNSRDLSLAGYLKLKSSFECGEGDRYAIEKFRLKDSLPGVEVSEFWTAEGIYDIRKNWDKVAPITLLWDLKNPDKAKTIAVNRWQRNIEESRFIGDCDRTPLAKTKYLQALKILALEGQEFSENSEIIQNIVKTSRDKRRGIRSVLGLNMGGLTPIKWISNILAKVGISLTSKQVKGQPRSYQFKEFTALEKAFDKWISDRRETLASKGLDGYHLTPKTDINNGLSVTKDQDNPPPINTGAAEGDRTPEPPKPLTPNYPHETVTFIRDGVRLTGELIGQQSDFIRVRVDGVNYLANTSQLVDVA